MVLVSGCCVFSSVLCVVFVSGWLALGVVLGGEFVSSMVGAVVQVRVGVVA